MFKVPAIAWLQPRRMRRLSPSQSRRFFRLPHHGSGWLAVALVPVLFAFVGFYEARTSALEATLLSRLSSRVSYSIGRGPSPQIVFPHSGPFNQIRGYASMPAFERRLTAAGFHIVAQSVFSDDLARLGAWGITPPYEAAAAAGLTLRDQHGEPLYDIAGRDRTFKSYEEIPPLIVKALLLVENRELEDSDVATRNPVVDWKRSAKAGLLYAGHKVGLPVNVEGGSTLATQIEKFRYAEGGKTSSAADKLRQMLSASLRVYHAGTDTREQRRQIILDYFNSLPLAAARGYGEVYGIGNGLYAWFGIDLEAAQAAIQTTRPEAKRAEIFKQMLTLICASRAPSFYLEENRTALDARVSFYVEALRAAGVITTSFAQAVRLTPVDVLTRAPISQHPPYVERKAVNAVRTHLLDALNVRNLYAVDRLDLDAETTLDAHLQDEVLHLFRNLKDPAFVDAHGLRQQQLLLHGDPSQITYSFSLFERTSSGNALRVQADTLELPFDLNSGMKLELGSTAKLRTLAHYLELVTSLYDDFRQLQKQDLERFVDRAGDPITGWTAQTLLETPGITLDILLSRALERRYSGNPGEAFFTGGGRHVFANFDSKEDSESFTLREGLQHSVNLVYIRLMRDLVRFHEARLPYDADAVLSGSNQLRRKKMLEEIADAESRQFLLAAYKRLRNDTADEIVERILGTMAATPRRLAILYLAWNKNADEAQLADWLRSHRQPASIDDARRWLKAYDPSRLDIADFGYLLNRHPLEVWVAGQIVNRPAISWDALLTASTQARAAAFRWLFEERNIRAQNLRLRTRIEADAFSCMLPYWQRLGFPFDHLVPSLATAIGSSADRPAALAELMGIILNDGQRLPTLRFQKLRFAGGTPYETVFAPNKAVSERAMEPAVARALRGVLEAVVENGTASRLAGAMFSADGMPIAIGGKTGSGDNRYESRDRRGTPLSRVINRTGTFAFFLGDRYFGVMTAYVGGQQAEAYRFTSALPVTALKLLAPSLASLATRGE